MIGCVPYLNAKPLIYGIKNDITFAPPAELAIMLANDVLSIALLPTYEIINKGYSYMKSPGIACFGEVKSVLLFYNCENIKDIRSIAVDKSSLSSASLLRILMSNHFHIECHYTSLFPSDIHSSSASFDAYLLIGDPAISASVHNKSYIDLGKAWHDFTGMPFVYALWAYKHENKMLQKQLTDAYTLGISHLDDIIHILDPSIQDFARDYLSKSIIFDISEREHRAIAYYKSLLEGLSLLNDPNIAGHQ